MCTLDETPRQVMGLYPLRLAAKEVFYSVEHMCPLFPPP